MMAAWAKRESFVLSERKAADVVVIITMEEAEQKTADSKAQALAVNEVLQVHFEADSAPVNYHCRIEDISGEKLAITWPTRAGIRMPVHWDQMLRFSMVRDGNAYCFSGMVDATSQENIPQIAVIIASAVEKVQRRQNFRIKCMIPVGITIFSAESGKDDAAAAGFIQTTTYDLSASGFAIHNQKRIPEGTLLDVKLSLPDNDSSIRIPCRVVYSEIFGENARLYHSGIQYLAITEGERARIVRYVYRTQLKGLRT
ncbi:MAG TPA: PilZ domain-containing protein [Acidobacteriota bacterium]|nr:PilZ domain-containing protein [Acidobacteriota bacterium]